MVVYFLTWTTYGSWLPGDERGWVDRHRGNRRLQQGNDALQGALRDAMSETAVILDSHLRAEVESAIRVLAAECGWTVHAVSVRTNHVHVVVSAPGRSGEDVMKGMKARASHRLNQTVEKERRHWWTRGGSKKKLLTPEAVARTVAYVKNQ